VDVGANVTWIFAGKEPFPLLPGRREDSTMTLVNGALQSFDHLASDHRVFECA
jgi:hypothetical protein